MLQKGGYYGWYRRYFIAIASESQTKFMIFNINFIIHTIFVVVMTAGFEKLNSAGILLMIKEIINHRHTWTETLVIISASMWTIDLISSLILFKKCLKTNTLMHYGKLLRKEPEKVRIFVNE